MGGSGSKDDDNFGPLPQQQIVSMTDGQPTQPSIAPGVSRVGQSMKSTAVRAPIRLSRVSLNAASDVDVEVSATSHGVVHLMAPAIELERFVQGESSNTDSKALWPFMQGEKLTKRVRASERCTISFEGSKQMLTDDDRRTGKLESLGDGMRRWPIVLQFIPVDSLEARLDEKSLEEPPDGALMACCVIENREVKIARQLIAWGGGGAAYVLKELFGIQEATTAPSNDTDIVDNQAQCVVCLTSLKDTALMPCGHFCVCYDCGVSIRLSPARNRCPLCRTAVEDIIKIDVAARADLPVPQSGALQASTPVIESPVSEITPPATTAADVEVSIPTNVDTKIDLSSTSETMETVKPGPVSMEEMRAARLRRLGQTEAHDSQQPDLQQVQTASVAATVTPPDLHHVVEAVEEDVSVPASSSTTSASDCLPPKCLRRLTTEMRQIEEKKADYLAEHGLSISLADPEGSDLRVWSLILRAEKVDADSTLGKALRHSRAAEIEFEVWIPNGFPISPPKVRVLRPTFGQNSFFVQAHGALCMETLTNQGWSPALSLLQLGVQIKTIMSSGSGSILSLNSMGDGCREQAWKTFERVESAHADWKNFSSG